MLTRIPRGLVSFFQCSLSFPLSAAPLLPMMPHWFLTGLWESILLWVVTDLWASWCASPTLLAFWERTCRISGNISPLCVATELLSSKMMQREKKYLLCYYQCCCFIMRENSHVIFGKIFFLVKNRVLLFVCSSTFHKDIFEQWFHFNSWSDDN